MTIGIIRRFNDYGVTINRLYLITLNVWCYFVCITLILIKAKRINWIPVSFSIISVDFNSTGQLLKYYTKNHSKRN